MIKLLKKYISLFLIGSVLMIPCCSPIAFSPNAQNEMVTPVDYVGEKQEVGGAFAYNKWMIRENPDTIYIRTYPRASISLFHNAYMGKEKSGVASIELVYLPLSWWAQNASGICLWFRPHLGFQYSRNVMTFRLNLTPLEFYMISESGEYGIDGGFSKSGLYQISFLLHNHLPSRSIYWTGIKNSPSALGLLAGGEHSFWRSWCFRAEYSFLIKPPFSLILNDDELQSIKGTVHYLTIGFFRRMK